MKILVLGDTCEDVFCYGSSKRLCPESPVPVFIPKETTKNLGMATNVYENIVAIDNGVRENMPVKSDISLFTNEALGSKTRYIDKVSNHMFLRVDTDDYDPCDKLPSNIEQYDLVVVSDYNKGFLRDHDLVEIAERSKLSFIDTKKDFNEDWARTFDFIKINEKEYLENGWEYKTENIVITKAEKGCCFMDNHYPIKKPSEVRDVSGAGDTFLAALSYSYACLRDIDRAINFAQECCQKVIQKKGVATV